MPSPRLGFGATGLILGVILARWFAAPRILTHALEAAAAIALGFLLWRLHRVVDKMAFDNKSEPKLVRAHLLLHLGPAFYLVAQDRLGLTLSLNLMFALPQLLFYWTGRCTWEAMATRFGAKLYRIFFRGNTGLLVTSGVLLLLGLATKPPIGVAFYCRLQLIYFSVHLLLTGFVVFKIERDLAAQTRTSLYPQ